MQGPRIVARQGWNSNGESTAEENTEYERLIGFAGRRWWRVRLSVMKSEPLAATGGTEGELFPMPEIDANGVDRSQIRKQLELTPFQRLQALESFLASTMRIRRGLRRPSISSDPGPSR